MFMSIIIQLRVLMIYILDFITVRLCMRVIFVWYWGSQCLQFSFLSVWSPKISVVACRQDCLALSFRYYIRVAVLVMVSSMCSLMKIPLCVWIINFTLKMFYPNFRRSAFGLHGSSVNFLWNTLHCLSISWQQSLNGLPHFVIIFSPKE